MKPTKWITALLAAAASLTLALAPAAQAQEDIVIGGSIPMSGVFAFAGIGIHAGNATRHNTFLDQGTSMPFMKRARPTDTKHLHKSGNNPGLNFPHVLLVGVDHMEQLVIAAATWFLHLHLHKYKKNLKVSDI